MEVAALEATLPVKSPGCGLDVAVPIRKVVADQDAPDRQNSPELRQARQLISTQFANMLEHSNAEGRCKIAIRERQLPGLVERSVNEGETSSFRRRKGVEDFRRVFK
jgi:hypothetical protein